MDATAAHRMAAERARTTNKNEYTRRAARQLVCRVACGVRWRLGGNRFGQATVGNGDFTVVNRLSLVTGRYLMLLVRHGCNQESAVQRAATMRSMWTLVV